MLDTLYKYAKFQYECGNYSGAAEYLYFYRVLVSSSKVLILTLSLQGFGVLSSQWYFVSTQVPGNDDRNTLNALWGKLGSEILMQNWETALEDLNRLKDVIESNVSFVNSYHSVALLYKIDLTWAINSLYLRCNCIILG